MKKLILVLLSTLIISAAPITAFAQEPQDFQIEYFDDGSYLLTYIVEDKQNDGISPYSTTTATKSKMALYYNSSNEPVWYVQVTGTFTYGNGSAKCTDSKVSAASYNKNWKITDKSAQKSGNKATATATAKHYASTADINFLIV